LIFEFCFCSHLGRNSNRKFESIVVQTEATVWRQRERFTAAGTAHISLGVGHCHIERTWPNFYTRTLHYVVFVSITVRFQFYLHTLRLESTQ